MKQNVKLLLQYAVVHRRHGGGSVGHCGCICISATEARMLEIQPKGMVFLICLHLLHSKRLFTYTGPHYSQWQPFESFIRGIFNWTLANVLQTNGPKQAWELCVCVCMCAWNIRGVFCGRLVLNTVHIRYQPTWQRWQAVCGGSVWFSQRKSFQINVAVYT